MAKNKNNKLSVIDLFSGVGGLSLGFNQTNYKIVAGIDNWQDALDTFSFNHPESETINIDLSTPNKKSILDKLSEEIDIVIGGPPCQGFSISGKRNPNDPRNSLYQSFVEVVDALKPKAFVLENVPNLVSMAKGAIKDNLISDFEKLGFTVTYKILLASDYGVPQNRKRVFFVGLRNGNYFRFPEPTHTDKKVSSFEAISDLPDESLKDGIKNNIQPKSEYQKLMRQKTNSIYNHQLTNHTEKTKSIISLVPDGGNYKDLPEKFKSIRNVNIAWTRFSSNKPSFTIDTGHRHHFHYKYNRVPTVRESARLQSFPDNFRFLGSKTSQYKQVGNAVPPLLAEAVANELRKQI